MIVLYLSFLLEFPGPVLGGGAKSSSHNGNRPGQLFRSSHRGYLEWGRARTSLSFSQNQLCNIREE